MARNNEKRWVCDSRKGELSKLAMQATQEVVDELTALAGREAGNSKYDTLEQAPDLYEGPVDAAAIRALAFEAAATFIWGAMYSADDTACRDFLLDTMAN